MNLYINRMNKQILDTVHPQILINFHVLKKVGQGAYGQVWKVKDKKTNTRYALKKIYDAFRNSTDAQRAYREIKYLQKLNHPNIIKIYSFFKPKDARDIYIALQFMEADLATAIKNKVLKDVHKHFIFYQIANAVHYLHCAQLIHRDLKPSNILVNENCDIKLCDFGLIRSLHTTEPHHKLVLTENIATRWYRAPQILLCSNNYGKEIDVWSLGCVLAEIFLGKPIFQGSSAISQLQRIFQITGKPTREQISFVKSQASKSIVQSMSVTKKYSIAQLFPYHNKHLVNLLQQIFQINPKKRIKIQQIMKHPLLSSFKSKIQQTNNIPIKIMYESDPLSVEDYKMLLNNQIEQVCGKVSEMSTFYESTITHSLNNQSRQTYLGSNYGCLGKNHKYTPQKANQRQIKMPIYHLSNLMKQDSHCNLKSNEPNNLRVTSNINSNHQKQVYKRFKTPEPSINKMNHFCQKSRYSPINHRSVEKPSIKPIESLFNAKRTIGAREQIKKDKNVPKFILQGKKKFKSRQRLILQKQKTVCYLEPLRQPEINQIYNKNIISPRHSYGRNQQIRSMVSNDLFITLRISRFLINSLRLVIYL